MALLGIGEANGGCSLLHAAGVGYGASLPLAISVKVALRDAPSKNTPDDPDGLLDAVLDCWKEAGHPLPDVEAMHWAVKSEIPPRQGLKSSSAIAIAALRALCAATDLELDNADLVDLASNAHRKAEITITGCKDDNWAACEPGWKLIDPGLGAAEGVLLQGPGPDPDDWDVLIVLREERSSLPAIEDFTYHQQGFMKALNALQEGHPIFALTWNGRSMAGVLNDQVGRRLANDAFSNGARGSAISGSGNAIVIFSPAVSEPTLKRLRDMYNKRGLETITTKPLMAPPAPVPE